MSDRDFVPKVEVMCPSCMITLDVRPDSLPVHCPRCECEVDDREARRAFSTELIPWPVKNKRVDDL